MKINGEAWPRAFVLVALLVAGCVLYALGFGEPGLMVLGVAAGVAAPAPSWTRKTHTVSSAASTHASRRKARKETS